MTLHEAMQEVLRDSPGGLSSREIADAVNAAGTYVRGDGQPLKSSQISARIPHYATLFERVGSRIRLVPR